MQSEYSLPRQQCSALCDDLRGCQLAACTPEFSEGEFLCRLSDGKSEGYQPFLSFWAANPGDENRRVDLHWIVGQDDLALRVEEFVRRRGGIVTFGGVGTRTK